MTDYGTVTSCDGGASVRPATRGEWLASVRAAAAGPMPSGWSIIPTWHDPEAWPEGGTPATLAGDLDQAAELTARMDELARLLDDAARARAAADARVHAAVRGLERRPAAEILAAMAGRESEVSAALARHAVR